MPSPSGAGHTGTDPFGHHYGRRGVAPNGIELHPVLDVEFL